MEKLNSEDGHLFIKNLARFVRTHEKALANALQQSRHRSSKSADSTGSANRSPAAPSSLASAALGALSFASRSVKPAKLTLTPHHLFYLLSRFEELDVPIGSMNIRLENINTEASSAYVSFLNKPQRPKSDRDSIHSVSSIRSVVSSMSAFWSSFGLGSKDSESKSEKARAALENDLKYLYSAFTKIPSLRLAPDYKARLIRGYEEFPFDTAVPLHAFKNLKALEIIDLDFRSFFGWDRISEQLRTLTLKRANIDDPADLLTRIVLDDIDKRRRRSTKSQSSPVFGTSTPRPFPNSESRRSISAPGSPVAVTDTGFGGSSMSPQSAEGSPSTTIRGPSDGARGHHGRTNSISPTRPEGSKKLVRRHTRGSSTMIRRTGSGSSGSSDISTAHPNNSSSNLLSNGFLPVSKWQFLRHLSLSDNSLTSISVSSLAPVAGTLHSLDLSYNLFTEVPDSLASLVALRSLNLSHCMIDSLHSLAKSPLPAITALNLRANRLRSIAGVERSLSLERLDLRDNLIPDPTEIARLTAIPYIREIWVSGNPFTRSHYGYRLTMFNLFRQTPGFSEDILIDAYGPGYSEKKQLVVRVAEPEAAPVVRRPEPEEPSDPETPVPTPMPLQTRKLAPTSSAPLSSIVSQDPQKPLPPTPTRHVSTGGSSRRKKTHRRRVIDLTQEAQVSVPEPADEALTRPVINHALTDPFLDTVETARHTRNEPAISGPSSRTTQDAVHRPTTTKKQSLSDNANSRILFPAVESVDWEVGGDLYRQRLEALKQELGPNWLKVLGEDTWDGGKRDMGVHPAVSEYGPPILPRSNSQVIVTGGRTLG